jgi:hypothetical protein
MLPSIALLPKGFSIFNFNCTTVLRKAVKEIKPGK